MSQRPFTRAGARAASRAFAAVAAIAIGLSLAPATSAATTVVTIGDSLSRRELTVTVGATVTWRNVGTDRHRVRSRSGPVEFDSGDLDPGESWSLTFGTPGTYPYHDDRNRELSRYWGTITVVARKPSPTAPGPTSPPSTGPATTAAISIVNRQFSPGSVTIAAGSTVRWRNADGREHTVTARDGSFDSGVLATGATYSKAFPTAGTYRFLCAIHPEMTGTVTVRGTSIGPAAPPPPTPAPKPTPPPAPSDGAIDASVRIVDFAFDAATTTVQAGATVTWRNTGAAPHTVTSAAGGWDSGLVASGASFGRRFGTPGTYPFVCTIHPQMSGVVVVTAATPTAPTVSSSSTGGSNPPAAAVDPSTPPIAVAQDAGAPPDEADPEPPDAIAPASASAVEPIARAFLVGAVWLAAIGVLGVAVRSTIRSR